MIQLLVTVPCKEAVRKSLTEEFSAYYDIVFAQEDPQIIAAALKSAEVIIGEPSPRLRMSCRVASRPESAACRRRDSDS